MAIVSKDTEKASDPRLALVEFGARVKSRREALGITLAEVSRALEFNVREVMALEDGGCDIGLNDLIRLAEVLRVHVRELMPAPGPPLSKEAYQMGLDFDAVLPEEQEEILTLMKGVRKTD